MSETVWGSWKRAICARLTAVDQSWDDEFGAPLAWAVELLHSGQATTATELTGRFAILAAMDPSSDADDLDSMHQRFTEIVDLVHRELGRGDHQW